MIALSEKDQKQFNEIFLRASTYCAYQDRCKKQVVEKLSKLETPEDWITPLVNKLEDEGFLDEERFAKSYCYGKFKSNKWGKNKIRQHLKILQVPEVCIEKGLNEIDLSEYSKLIDKLIEQKKRNIRGGNSFQQKQKLFNYLTQKGFEHDLFRDKI